MSEELVSVGLFKSGSIDSDVEVLSWQSVDGKGYFAADVKLRMPDGRRLEPDLIIRLDTQVWLIEVKGKHSEALDDEDKLTELLDVLGKEEILRQIEVRCGREVVASEVVLAVAYFGDDLDSSPEAEDMAEARCGAEIVHIDWEVIEAEVLQAGLSASLRLLYSAEQRST